MKVAKGFVKMMGMVALMSNLSFADTLSTSVQNGVFHLEMKGSQSGISEEIFNMLLDQFGDTSTETASSARELGIQVRGRSLVATGTTGDLIAGPRNFTVSFEIDARNALQCKSESKDSYKCFSFGGEAAAELKDLLQNSRSKTTSISCFEVNAKPRCTLKYAYEYSSSRSSGYWD